MKQACAALAVLFGCGWCGSAAAQGLAADTEKRSALRSRISLELGSEYDSNVHRLELPEGSPEPIAGAPLLRGAVRSSTRLRLGPRSSLSGRGVAAAKLFFGDEGQSENVGMWSFDARYDRVMRSRRAITSFRAAGYESYALDPAGGVDELRGRNFSTKLTEFGLTVPGPGHHRIGAIVGVRSFRYKPDADFDWTGDHYGLSYQTTIWRGDPELEIDVASIDVDVRYQLGRRSYQGKAYLNNCSAGVEPDPSCVVPTSFDRSDLQHRARAAASYTGDRVWTASYELQVADSNSFGQSLFRQRLELGLTSEIAAEVYATARATITFNSFLDSLLLTRDVNAQTFVSIDDENRNSLSLHIARDFWKRWTGEARYAIYSNEFAADEFQFRRHIGYLGIAYKYD